MLSIEVVSNREGKRTVSKAAVITAITMVAVHARGSRGDVRRLNIVADLCLPKFEDLAQGVEDLNKDVCSSQC